jgi:hypothetical protein
MSAPWDHPCYNVGKHTELLALADAYAMQLGKDCAASMGSPNPTLLAERMKSYANSRDALSDALKQVVQDAERYRFLFDGNKVYSQFSRAYSGWDGAGGKDGFDAAIDAAMKEKP